MKEKWKPLYDFPGYEVSDMGNIRSLDRKVMNGGIERFYAGRIIKPRVTKKDIHLFVSISFVEDYEKVRKTIYLQKAVADHFVKKPTSKHVFATNLSGDYSDNRAKNIGGLTAEDLVIKQTEKNDPHKMWRTRRNLYGETGMKRNHKPYVC